MQTMRTVCPDCGSEMFNQPDDFDFETNFTGVSCADCGREITKDDVVNQATDTVKKTDRRHAQEFPERNWLEVQVTLKAPQTE